MGLAGGLLRDDRWQLLAPPPPSLQSGWLWRLALSLQSSEGTMGVCEQEGGPWGLHLRIQLTALEVGYQLSQAPQGHGGASEMPVWDDKDALWSPDSDLDIETSDSQWSQVSWPAMSQSPRTGTGTRQYLVIHVPPSSLQPLYLHPPMVM